MVTPDDRVKVLDFGIAKLMGEADKRLTRTGTKMGTVLYMSPEQVLGQDVDARSDIYALGVVLWEMLTGRCPYDQQTMTEFAVYSEIVNAPLPDPRTVYPAISEALVQIIATATAKTPAARFQTCPDFLVALEAAAAGKLPLGVKLATLQPAISHLAANPTGAAAISAPTTGNGTPISSTDAHSSTPLPVALPAPAPLTATRPRKRRSGLGWLFVLLLVGGFVVAAFFYQPLRRLLPLPQPKPEREELAEFLTSFYQALQSENWAQVQPFFANRVSLYGNPETRQSLRQRMLNNWASAVNERYFFSPNFQFVQEDNGNTRLLYTFRMTSINPNETLLRQLYNETRLYLGETTYTQFREQMLDPEFRRNYWKSLAQLGGQYEKDMLSAQLVEAQLRLEPATTCEVARMVLNPEGQIVEIAHAARCPN
jgi:serine/threonine protein kinase